MWANVVELWEHLGFPYEAAVARFERLTPAANPHRNRQRAAAAARTALETAQRLGATPLADQLRLLAERGRLDLDPMTPPSPDQRPTRRPWNLTSRGRGTEAARNRAHEPPDCAELYISEKTASVHVTHLLRKLGAANRVEAAAIAQRLRLAQTAELDKDVSPPHA